MPASRAEQYARVRAIFLQAIDQQPEQREAFVRAASAGDARVLAEVRSLLRHHDPRTILKAPAADSTRGGAARASGGRSAASSTAGGPQRLPVVARAAPIWWRRNLRLVVAVLLAAGAFTALLLWTGARVRAALQRGVGEQLEALADAGVTGVTAWMDAQRTLVASWALDSRLVEQTHALAVLAQRAQVEGGEAAAVAAVRAAPAVAELRALFEPLAHLAALRGFGLMAADGRVLLSRETSGTPGSDLLGRRMPEAARALLAPMFEGQPFVVLPYDVSALLGNAAADASPGGAPAGTGPREGPAPAEGSAPGESTAPGSALAAEPRAAGTVAPEVLLSVVAPVRAPAIGGEPGAVIAVLAFQLHPERDFTRILTTTRLGSSGEVYAFDRQGRMLSESRFTEQLRRIGLLPDVPGSSAALAVRLLDPGTDLTAARPGAATPLAQRPFTAMARAALEGEDGVNVEGYRDYRGVEVVGAWRWLESDGFGVAAEQDRVEAYAALDFPRTALLVLLLALGAALLALLAFAVAIARLRTSMRTVQKLGQYTLEELLGEGGMGRVYRARHALLARPTAVKLLRPDRVDETMLARFAREVKLTSRLTHPNTIDVYDYGRTSDGLFYYAMECLEGGTLEDLVALDGALPASRVIHILRQVCLSLREAHGLGLLHRDIKPMNIFLCERGGEADFVKVLDFGLAKDLHAGEGAAATASVGVLGTPLYIAPERLRPGAEPDARSDLYAVGAVAFKLLTGQDLFPGESAFEICAHTLHDPPRRPSTCTPLPLPEDLDQLVMELLAKDPAWRPASAEVVLELLDSVHDCPPWTAEDARDWWRRRGADLRAMHDLARGAGAAAAQAPDAAAPASGGAAPEVGPLGIEPRTNGL